MTEAFQRAGCVGCLALVATGCGSHRSSAAAFRAQANGICGDVSRLKRSVDFATTAGFAKGLAGMRAGARRLAAVQPPRESAGTYHDLLANLRDIDAFLDSNRVRLLEVEHRLKVSSGRAAARAIRHFRALILPLARDGLRAAGDARALGLGVCATDLSGGAPFRPGPGGQTT
jgi:hypothetical protein